MNLAFMGLHEKSVIFKAGIANTKKRVNQPFLLVTN